MAEVKQGSLFSVPSRSGSAGVEGMRPPSAQRPAGRNPGGAFPPYQRHSATSRDAAAKAKPSAATLRALVLGHLGKKGVGGATDEEMFIAMINAGVIPPTTKDSTIRARRVELVRDGLVGDSGNERRTRSGRTATVWVAKRRPAAGEEEPRG